MEHPQAMERPQASEYHSYYATYIGKVPSSTEQAGDILAILEQGIVRTATLLRDLPEETASFRYAPDKWSLKEVLGHMIDTERLFAYRALSIGRGDPTPLPGMDQDVWARGSNADRLQLSALLEEFEVVRHSSLCLFRGFTPENFALAGTASDCPFTVRSLAYVIAGHEIHHRGVIEERYLKAG